jgi:uncharacterized protein
MTPFRFGPPERQLFGIHHPGTLGHSPVTGVLMCNPFGQEAVRTHRLQRVLAERLASRGIHVMRFDYHGTGDSSGDDNDGQLDIWQNDILTAHQELQRRAMCTRVIWLGVRLGASLAAMACARTPRKPDRLLLWEPIAHGSAYLDKLARYHRMALAGSYNVVPPQHRHSPRHEAVGFGISPVLHEQLATLDATHWPALRVPELALIGPAHNPDAPVWQQLLARSEGRHQTVLFEHNFDWASEEALNTALVPTKALELLAQLVEAAP